MNSRFNFAFLENSTEILRAVAHPIRIAIIDILYEANEMTVTEIHEQLNIEQAIASHHLRILKDKGVVISKRDGKNSFYTLKSPAFYDLIRALELELSVA